MQIDIKEEKDVWVVYENTDNTEGSGYQYPTYVCQVEETAKRLAKGRGVQGSDAYYYKMKAVYFNNTWLAPALIITPTKQDLLEKQKNDKIKDVLEKAKALGLSDEDIETLKKGG
jgi:hypothetical protein